MAHRSLIARASRSPLLLLTTVFVAVACVLAAMPSKLADGPLELLVLRVPLSVLALVAVHRGVSRVSHPGQRRFWRLVAVGLATLTAIWTLLALRPWLPWSATTDSLLIDVLTLVVCTAMMIATQPEPDRPPGALRRPGVLRTDRLGVLFGFPIIFAYLVAVPAIHDPSLYASGISSIALRLALGGVVTGRLLHLGASSPSRRWRTILLLLGSGAAMWIVLDAIALARGMGGGTAGPPALELLLRSLPPALAVLAALVRDRVLLPQRRHHVEGYREAIGWRVPGVNFATACLFIVIHLIMRRMSPIDPTAIPVRDAITAIGFVGMMLFVVAQVRSLRTAERGDRTVVRVLSDVEFAQSRRMEALGHMAGSVAHDFNNLLAVISGNTELLRDALGSRAEAGFAREVDAAVNRASAMTRQLLAFSRSQVLQAAPVEVGRLLDETRAMLQRLLPEDVEIELRPLERPAAVLADPHQLSRALLNLGVNAGEAMPGGGRLTIAAEPVDLESAWLDRHSPRVPRECVMLSFTDTGVGMPESTRRRAFEPFYTTRRESGGTGLGLSTVFGIVAQSNGHVEIDSEPGRGTTVRVFLPRTPVPDPRSEPVPLDADTPQGDPHARVLLAEDDPALLALLRDDLSRRGYHVRAAADGAAALALLERPGDVPDVLVTDLVMPRVGGRELVRAVRERWPTIGVVYITGHVGPGAFEPCGDTARTTWLAKPFELAELDRAIRRLLRERVGGATGAGPSRRRRRRRGRSRPDRGSRPAPGR